MLALYKTRFQIASLEQRPPVEVADDCIRFIADWVRERLSEPGVEEMTVVEDLDRSSIAPQLRRIMLDNGAFHHSFLWRKPDENDDQAHWVSVIDLVSDGAVLDFQIQLGVEKESLILQTKKHKTGRPRLIPRILSHPHWACTSGEQRLSVQPTKLSVGEIESFCEDVLYSDKRELPIVVITAQRHTAYFPVKPLILAERLGGTAKTFQIKDSLAIQVLDQFLGKALAIGPYAVRVFAPGLEPGASLEEHWHFLGDTVRAKRLSDIDFSDFLFQKLAERALPRFRESLLLQRFRQLAAFDRQQKVEAMRAQQRLDQEYYEEYARTLEAQNRELIEENNDLEGELGRREEQIVKLERELAAARENVHRLSAELNRPLIDHAELPAPEEPSQTVLEIVENAASTCRHLIILDSAIRSAKDMPRTFKFPERVQQAIAALELGAEERREKRRISNGWRVFFAQLGFDYKATLSDTARNAWGDEYKFQYESRREIFDEHFTIGTRSANTCISLHFSTRLRDDKIVLAYVGRHLRNTQS